METPLVSVLIPCYNCEKYVEEAVRSIMEQTYQNLEILCINDGSTDNTKAILQRLAQEDKRIIYVENETNLKLIATLNKGLQLCQGKYIARMDADDISLPQRIEKQIYFMEKNPECGLVGSFATVFFSDGKQPDTYWNSEITNDHLKGFLFYRTPLCHPTIMMRKSVIDKHKLTYSPPPEYLHIEDYKLFYDFSQVSEIHNIPEFLVRYRRHTSQITSSHKKAMEDSTRTFQYKIINRFLSQYQMNIPSVITTKSIGELSRIKGNKYQVFHLKMVYYMSMKKYTFLDFLYFVFSGDFFRFLLRKSAKITIKFLNPKRFESIL